MLKTTSYIRVQNTIVYPLHIMAYPPSLTTHYGNASRILRFPFSNVQKEIPKMVMKNDSILNFSSLKNTTKIENYFNNCNINNALLHL